MQANEPADRLRDGRLAGSLSTFFQSIASKCLSGRSGVPQENPIVTSRLPRLDFRVEPLEFDSGTACRELPVSSGLAVVSGGGPFVDSLGGLVLAGNAVGKALPGHHTQFRLGHVQPTAIHWRVDDFESAENAKRLFWQGCGIERRRTVRIEGVANQRDSRHRQLPRLQLVFLDATDRVGGNRFDHLKLDKTVSQKLQGPSGASFRRRRTSDPREFGLPVLHPGLERWVVSLVLSVPTSSAALVQTSASTSFPRIAL